MFVEKTHERVCVCMYVSSGDHVPSSWYTVTIMRYNVGAATPVVGLAACTKAFCTCTGAREEMDELERDVDEWWSYKGTRWVQ